MSIHFLTISLYSEYREEAKMEEVIAVLWLIAAILAFSQEARTFGYIFLLKSLFDHACLVGYVVAALNAKQEETKDGK